MKSNWMILSLLATLSIASAIADDTVNPAQNLSGTVQYSNTAPATPAPEAVNMMNVATPAAALAARDYLSISTEPVQGKGGYQAVRYTIKNLQPNHLQIISGEVLNSVDEVAAANRELQQANTRKKVAGGVLRGLSALPFAGGFGYASVGAYRAAAVGTHLANAAATTMDNTAEGNVLNVEGRFIRNLNSVVINPNETYTFSSLILNGETPRIKLVFKNLETNQIFDLQQ